MNLTQISTVRHQPRYRVLDYVRIFYLLNRLPPTSREIQKALGLSLGSVTLHLHRLASDGELRRLPGSRGYVPTRTPRLVDALQKVA